MAKREIARAIRMKVHLSVLMLDVDYFKRVNDTHGHTVGDSTLRMIADLCSGRLRAVDLIGRFGGDEFIFVLPETDLDGADIVANEIRETIANTPVNPHGNNIRVTVCLGIASLSDTTRDLERLLVIADEALYEAKETGRNRVIRKGA